MTESEDDRMRRLVTGEQPRPLPKRFYKSVSVSEDFRILLDGRPVRTPLKSVLVLPNAELAEAVASEWEAQKDVIDPSRMPHTKLANTALDRAEAERANITRELVQYANSDLVCYRAEKPEILLARQGAAWDPVISWIEEKLGVRFSAVKGVVHRAQDGEALAAFEGYLVQLDRFQLTAHYNISTLTGSALLATMLIEGGIPADEAWTAAHVDEDFQIEEWGWDSEAQARRAVRRAEFDATCRFSELARPKIIYGARGVARLT